MNRQDIRAGVIAAIRTIALNVIVGLHERFRVDIPEADYAKLSTLDAIVAYLAAKVV